MLQKIPHSPWSREQEGVSDAFCSNSYLKYNADSILIDIIVFYFLDRVDVHYIFILFIVLLFLVISNNLDNISIFHDHRNPIFVFVFIESHQQVV